MTKIYLIISVCAIIIGAFFYGEHVGNSKCKLQNLHEQIKTTENKEINKRIINDKVYKTGVADIRGVLRDKYTIKE